MGAGLLAASPGDARGQATLDREVVSLEFEGNAAYSDGRLSDAILARATDCRSFVFVFPLPLCPLTDWGFAHDRGYLDEGTLPADLLRLRLFYRRRGYREVAVDTVVSRDDGRADLRFVIEEGEPTRVTSLDFDAPAGVLDTAAAREAFPLEPGSRLDLVELDRGKQRLVDQLREDGHIHAAVLDEYFIPTGSREAELTVRVESGPRARIGEVTVQGAGELGEDVVRQFLTFGSGERYRRSRILESQRALYQLDAIRFANLETRTSSPSDTLVDVVVDVTPARKRAVRTGAGVTTTDCLQTEASITHRNFLGDARRLELSGRLSNLLARDLAGTFPCTSVGERPVFHDLNFALRAEFLQPYFLSSRNELSAALFFERETVPEIYVRNSRGGELSLTRRLRAGMYLSLTVRPELTSFDEESADVFFCINFGFCQPDDIDVLTDPRWLSPVTVTWRYDRTDAPISPSDGYYVSADLERGSVLTGSDYRYLRFNVNAAAFEELTPGLVLATRLRTGLVEPTGGRVFGGGTAEGEPVVHPRTRFFAGGPQSVRGFGQNLLGPTVLVVDSITDCPDQPLDGCVGGLAAPDFEERPVGGDAAFEVNLELRARTGGPWTVVGFLDAGQVWEDYTHLEFPVATPGVGVRYDSPVGPLRLDLGYDPSSPQRLPVVAEVADGELVELDDDVTFMPYTWDDPGRAREIWRRLRLHISIGEAF